MTIENSVSNDFLSTFADNIDVFDCPLPAVKLIGKNLGESVVYNNMKHDKGKLCKYLCQRYLKSQLTYYSRWDYVEINMCQS